MIGNYTDIAEIIEVWTPKGSTEKKLRDDLTKYIRKELKERAKSFWRQFLEDTDFVIMNEAGRARADIEINRNIGIEIKLSLKGKTEIDRLCGQVGKYMESYEHVFVVLCGDVSDQNFEETRRRLNKLCVSLLPPTILSTPVMTIVKKD